MIENWQLPNGQKIILIGPEEKIEEQKKVLTRRYEITREHGLKMGWPERIEEWTLEQSLSVHDLPEWQDPLGTGRKIKNEITIDLGGGSNPDIFPQPPKGIP